MSRISLQLKVSAAAGKEFPRDDKPEIALVGRSNVGKSSLLNALAGVRNIAKTSSVPGKTQRVNFYLANNSFYLVDLPGYGYARVPDALKEHWVQLIEGYLRQRRQLQGVVQVVDFRHSPAETDREMAEMLRFQGLPFVVVATKADKVSRGHWRGNLAQIRMALNLPGDPLLFSARSGQGKEELAAAIFALIQKKHSLEKSQ